MKKFLVVFTSKRMAVVTLLGFSSGLPLALVLGTMQAWLKDSGVDITIIGLFAAIQYPYTFKFAWSFFMDRYTPSKFGRRRSWLLIWQIILFITISLMGFVGPSGNPWIFAFFAFLVAFSSASQDIVVDAYRADILPEEEYGLGSSVYIMGYRIAMIVSGAGALWLADQMPWNMVYFILACCMGVGVLTTFWAKEPEVQGEKPHSLIEAILPPFKEFFSRTGAIEILVFIVVYKMTDAIAGALVTPFLMDIGFSKTEIAGVQKAFGLVCTILGAFMGGLVMVRIGMKRSLWLFLVLAAVSNLAYYWVAIIGKSEASLIAAVVIENLSGGMATAGFAAFMLSLCDRRFSATQYALLTSFMAQTRILGSMPTGFMAKWFGWDAYFLISILFAVPAAFLLLRYDRWSKPGGDKITKDKYKKAAVEGD